ncbi:hypothetical protein GCK72_006818 [Caenorhabditis remanei]|uniref:Uncharacterized protein n=1 Tax=Caenorhabditis remanei TaxID=31234 RepID=A0A6A5HFX9_CAERE|nr:hypothetical protein GCK72_006818 [Caenorhabditis remanei]KAF1766860.1 hypothetical protein GCK72_006818 [Caenorhabditis remanei]
MSRFSGKTVIVTGSSNGIGRSTALLFAKYGANVTITGRNADRLEETRQLLLKSGVSEKNINAVVADQPGAIYYAIAKAALDQYTRSTAIDLIQYGIRVNSVSPGIVVTEFGGEQLDCQMKCQRSSTTSSHLTKNVFLLGSLDNQEILPM